MMRFGRGDLVGLGHVPEAGVPSFLAQVAAGMRPDGAGRRLAQWLRLNWAHVYINRIRKASNDPAWLARAGRIERRLRQPLARIGATTERARAFRERDYHIEHGAIPKAAVEGLRADLFAQDSYNDPYVAGFAWHGDPTAAPRPLLYIHPQALFANPHFLAICANPQIIAFCREVLGPGAAITWAWAWISNPGFGEYQNQNWHRDCSEPLNFIRVFVPLNDIASLDDGPTALIPGTSTTRRFYDVRRFNEAELTPLIQEKGAGALIAAVGDVYFVNTFCLHRGVRPTRQRAILTMLVSLGPSHRSPAICPMTLAQVPAALRDTVRRNRRFFRYLVA
jgi:hypothetical protein